MAVSTITGLGSGLDINSLVKALADAEKAPKQTQIDVQKARTDTQLSAVGMLRSALETFESSLLGLKSNSSAFDAHKASSSKADVASVSLRPIPATASKVASAPLPSDGSTLFGAGTLAIKVGNESLPLVNIADDASLQDVRDAINSQLSVRGITASIETDADGMRLVLSSSKTGAGKDISVTGTGGLTALDIDGSVRKSAGGAGYVTRSADAVQISSGSYVLKVDKLATASKVATALQVDGPGTWYADGELSIRVGATGAATKISLPKGGTLEQIRDAINEQMSSKGIQANIISDSSGARLVLSSQLTGAGNDIYVSGTGAMAALSIDPAVDGKQVGDGAGWLTEASDAEFSIDGLKMTSKDNTANSLQGLGIKLLEEGTTTISVSPNTDNIVNSVESFVMAYNTLLTVTNGLTKVTQTTDKDGNATTQAGALVADSTLRSMLSQLRRVLANPVEGAGGLKSLADLGVSTNRDGTLSLDNDKLRKVVSQDPVALAERKIPVVDVKSIQEFFTGKDGLFNRIGDITSVYSGKEGLLASREQSLTDAKESLAVDQARLDMRIASLTTSLYKKFNAMDTLVARLNATSQSVLATLNALNKKKDD